MKLIKEMVTEVKFLTEADAKGKQGYFIEGIFMQADIPNKNRRKYKLDTLLRGSERYNREYITPGRAFGELGHPNSPTINLERVSHLIIVLRPEGTNFYGKAKILDTPYGKIVQNPLDEGAQIGVSTRGLGSVTSGPEREPETEIAGFFWMQGESDSYATTTANLYATNLTKFIQRLRGDLGQTNLPFAAPTWPSAVGPRSRA